MGFRTIIELNHDQIDKIESDPNFGENLAKAMRKAHMEERVPVKAGGATVGYIVAVGHTSEPLGLIWEAE